MAEVRRLQQKDLIGIPKSRPVPKRKSRSESEPLDKATKFRLTACDFGFGRNSREPVFGEFLDIHTTEPVHPPKVTKVEGNSLFSAF